jgi:hypothetical protein
LGALEELYFQLLPSMVSFVTAVEEGSYVVLVEDDERLAVRADKDGPGASSGEPNNQSQL